MYMKEGLFIMKMNVLSVKETEFTDKQTNQVRKMWQVFLPDETGAVGYIYSTEPVKTGDSVDVRLSLTGMADSQPKSYIPKRLNSYSHINQNHPFNW